MVSNLNYPFLISLILIFMSVITQPTPSDNCLNYNVNNGVCQQCVSGFYLQYYFCLPCSPRCQCSSRNNFCESCIQTNINDLYIASYHDQNLNQCILCSSVIENCLKCDHAFNCSKCFNGSYKVQEKDINGVVTKVYCSQYQCTNNCQFCLDS